MRRRTVICIILALLLTAFVFVSSHAPISNANDFRMAYTFAFPTYTGEETVPLNGDRPCIDESELTAEAYLSLSELDELGRCGAATACIGPEILATEPRGEIGMVKPSGWHTVRYDFVDGKYLYNRCHLVGYQLCGVNADVRNLITGTRCLNLDGMLPAENRVYAYVAETGNHVFYRITPRFSGNDLVAKGVEMEAYSIEDHGKGICFHIFCFNVQPGVVVDYRTGDSRAEENSAQSRASDDSAAFVPSEGVTYVLNTNTMRFHKPGCTSVQEMKAKNRKEFFGTRDELIAQGYVPCGRCNP